MTGFFAAGLLAVAGTGTETVHALEEGMPERGNAGISGHLSQMLIEGWQMQPQDAVSMLVAASREEKQEEVAQAVENEVPEVESEYADIGITQVNYYVNVRSEPSTEGEILGKLYRDSAATVHDTVEGTDGAWYHVTSGTVDGYIKAEYLVVGDEELARSVGTRYATVDTTTLFVRSEPTTESAVLTMLPEGDDLVVLDDSNEGWVMVDTEEGKGYISTDYVILTTEYTEAESREEEEARLAREEAERQQAAAAAEAARREAEAAKKAAEEAAKKPNKTGSGAGNSNFGAGSSNSGTGSSNSGGSSSGNSSSVSNGQAVVDYAMQFLGNPYVYGGNSLTQGTDCSGFVKGVYAAFGVSLPRTSSEQRSSGYEVSLSDAKPGDIICYSGHVGIYVGNDTIIHASSEKTGIKLTSPVTYRNVLTVRRIF